MPAHLIAASIEDSMASNFHHGSLAAHFAVHQAEPTSFIRMPISRRRLWDMLVGPEIRAYHWLQDSFNSMYHRVFDGVGSDQARIVEYIAANEKNSEKWLPEWNKAMEQWNQYAVDQGVPLEVHRLVWQRKQCLDEHFHPGKDYKECKAQGVDGFPVVKFFAPGSETGDRLDEQPTSSNLLEFAKTGIDPKELHIPISSGDEKVYEGYVVALNGSGCPSCKALDYAWPGFQKKWNELSEEVLQKDPDHDNVRLKLEKKQCFDSWSRPGKDFDFCQKAGIKASQDVPSVAVYEPGPHGWRAAYGDNGQLKFFATDKSSYTAEKLRNWLAKEAQIELKPDGHFKMKGEEDHHKAPEPESAKPHEAAPAPAVIEAGDKKVAAEALGENKVEEHKEKGEPLVGAVKAALAPLPLLSCLPSYPKRTGARNTRTWQESPDALAGFL